MVSLEWWQLVPPSFFISNLDQAQFTLCARSRRLANGITARCPSTTTGAHSPRA